MNAVPPKGQMPNRDQQGQEAGDPIHLTMSFEDDEDPAARASGGAIPGLDGAEAQDWMEPQGTGAETRGHAPRNGPRRGPGQDDAVDTGGPDRPVEAGVGETRGAGRGGTAERSQRAALLPQFAGIELSLTVEVGSLSIALKDLVAVEPGQLLALDRMTSEPVSVLVNGKAFARGEIVAVGDRYGVRLLEIVAPTGGAG